MCHSATRLASQLPLSLRRLLHRQCVRFAKEMRLADLRPPVIQCIRHNALGGS